MSYFLEDKEIPALRDINFDVEKGEIISIIGESGSGKTTLAKSIIRQIKKPGKIISGKVLLEGNDLLAMDYSKFKRDILWKEISYVPQASQNSLNGVMRIIDHFYDTALSHNWKNKEEVNKKAKELLKMVALDEKVLKMYPHELSGGMKQRVLIALSLLLTPKIVIMDEPVSALDVVTQRRIIDLIVNINKELGTTILFITHDIALTKYLSTKTVVMYAGRVMEIGNTYEVIFKPYHPYTQALVNSIPSIHGEISVRSIKEGEIPLHGCPFYPRCPYTMEECKVKEPDFYHVDGREVRCFMYDKVRKSNG